MKWDLNLVVRFAVRRSLLRWIWAALISLAPAILLAQPANDNFTNRIPIGISSALGTNGDTTFAVAIADLNNDSRPDIIVGNLNSQPSRLYLNNGTTNPFAGVIPKNITADTRATWSIAVGDVTGEGRPDIITGNISQPCRLYTNNGTADPFAGVTGSDAVTNSTAAFALALADLNGDGWRDLVTGNGSGAACLLFTNNHTRNPYSGVVGIPINASSLDTRALAVGDVNGDGRPDLILGNNNNTLRLYTNNGTANPFNGVAGTSITSDSFSTRGVAIGDVTGDSKLDLIVANRGQALRLYTNNGTSNPFNGISGSDIQSGTNKTSSVALADLNGDGKLDVVIGVEGIVDNEGARMRYFLNNGTANPFFNVSAGDVSVDTLPTLSVALSDLNGDGRPDLVAGNTTRTNRVFLNSGGANPFAPQSLTNISLTANTLNATREDGEPLHAGNAGGHSVWWTWTAPVTGLAMVDTLGSSFDTLLAVYTGTSVSNLFLVSSNDDAGLPVVQSRVAFSAIAGATYHIAVDGYNGEAGNVILNLKETTVQISYAATLSPSSITTTGATFNGMATPNGAPSVAWFEWGTNYSYGQTTPPADVGSGQSVNYVSRPVSLSFGPVYHYRLVVSNILGVVRGADSAFILGGTTCGWGVNADDRASYPVPLNNLVAVAAGDSHSMALRNDGTVFAWGNNSSGQTNVPAGLSNVIAIAAGRVHSLALRSNGTVAVWGDNNDGQTNLPANLDHVISIGAGDTYSVALRDDGSVIAWGDKYNRSGAMDLPLSLTNIVAIAPGYGLAMALRADGNVIAWGKGSYCINCGQTNVPPGLSNVIAIATGASACVALRKDGTITQWGSFYAVPANATNLQTLANGPYISLALRTNGTVTSWGGSFGYSQSIVPPGLNNVVALAGGAQHIVALLTGTSPSPGVLNFQRDGFFSSSITVNENDSNAVLIVTRSGGSAGNIAATYSLFNNSATAGQDFVSGTGTVQFTNGQAKATILVPLISDFIVEDPESFRAELTNATGGAVLGDAYYLYVYLNDALNFLQLDANGYSVNEAGSSVNIGVTRSGNGVGSVALDVTTSDGSATAGVDYAPANQHLTWANGEMGTKYVAISVANNSAIESNKTFYVTLANPVGVPSLSSPASAQVTILDDDSQPVIEWDSAAYTFNENAGYAAPVIRRSGGAGTIQVVYATSNLTAVAGLDYLATTGSVTFAAGEALKVAPVVIFDDYPIEGNETFSLRLLKVVGASLGAISNTVVTIRDTAYSPEDLYGHMLQITNESLFADFYSAQFTNRLTIFNPSPATSRPGFVELTGLYQFIDLTNRFYFPPVPGLATMQVIVYGFGAGYYLQDGVTRYVYATVYENAGDTNLPPQAQGSTGIFYTLGASPPDGGVPSGGGSGLPAQGFSPPPAITNTVVAGPGVIDENAATNYTATAYFNNGTISTNLTVAWSSSLFSISPVGRFTAGNVNADSVASISGAITYGNVTKAGAASTLILNTPALSLGGLTRSNGQFRLQIAGTTGKKYALEFRTNLAPSSSWFPLVTNQIFSNSAALFVDANATNSARFYRVRLVP